MISRDEILDRFVAGDAVRKEPKVAATAVNLSTVRLSSGISANILDFRLPQKHVLRAMLAGRPAARLRVQAGNQA